MGKNPANQFYWADWLRDTAILTLEERGVWITCLAHMWFANERGVLEGTWEDFSTLFGCQKRRIKFFFAQISRKKVCELENISSNEIRIKNRRMIREEKERKATCERAKTFREKGGGQANNWTAIRIKILQRDDSMCAYCGRRGNDVDYILPRSQGGTEETSNLVVCCKRCGGEKNNRTLGEAGMDFWEGFNKKKLQNNITITPPITQKQHQSNTKVTPPSSRSSTSDQDLLSLSKEQKERAEKTSTPLKIQDSKPKKKIEKTLMPHQKLVEEFKNRYEQKFNAPYVVDKKDFILASQLLKNIKLDECIKRLNNSFRGEYWFGLLADFAQFRTHFNELGAPPAEKNIGGNKKQSKTMIKHGDILDPEKDFIR